MDAAMNVRLGAKTKGFQKAMNKVGKSVKKIGASMTRNLTFPILAVGAASVKLSMDFEKSMTKINTLVRGSSADLGELKTSVLNLSKETAQAPVELAEGLYFLESAGLEGANALETLEAVSKASASGMGDMEALSVVAAAAQNAYGEETLTAADALDKFGVMVQTGMFDAQELSNVLGKQLGLASNLGISFDEVGALISTYTQTTGDATAATNGLSAIMMTFAKLESEPTKKQAEALDAIGMSAEEVQTMMGEQGLMATMQHLQTEFDAAGVPMADFFTKSQALKGALGVLGTQTESYTENLDAMGGSLGFVDEAFDTTSQTSAFQMEQAMNSLKVAGTTLGESLTPVVISITEKITALTDWWMSLDDSTQDNIASWMTWIAIAGPVIMAVGKLIVFGGKAIKMFRVWKTAIAAAGGVQAWFNGILIANPIGIIITLVGLVIAAFVYFSTSTSNLAIKVRNGFKSMMNGVIRAINSMIKGINKYSSKLGFTLSLMSEFEMETLKSVDAVDDKTDAIDDLSKAVDAIPDIKTTEIETNFTGDAGDDGGSGSGSGSGDKDSKEAERKAERDAKAKADAEKRSLEKIRKLKQQFAVLNESDKQQAALLSLENNRENELLKVADTIHAEDEKILINKKFNKQRADLEKKHQADNQKARDKELSSWDKMFNSIKDGYKKITEIINQLFDGWNKLADAQANKEQTQLDNKQKLEQDDYDKWYERELMKIENTISNEEKKNEAIDALDEAAATKKTELDKKQDDEQKVLMREAAKREKSQKVMSAIMGTAAAVVNALGSAPPPANFILAGVVGGMGAMQIATIASTPLPELAEGGLAFGETIAKIGEYQGASSNPEVIAPLSKLQNMMGGNQKIEIFGKMHGNDIWLSNDFANTNRKRYT